MSNRHRLKEEIVQYGKLLVEKGLVTGSGGNISVCLRDEELMLITPSGMDYHKLVPEDIVVMDLKGNMVQGSRKPSVEKNLHRAIYLARKDVNAVVHTHSIYATTIAATRQDLPMVLGPVGVVFGGSIKTAKYAGIGTRELAENVVDALGTKPAVLLANHGMVGVGSDLAVAFHMCELTEVCAQTYIFAKIAGEPVVLSEELLREEKAGLDKEYGQK